MKFKTVTKLFSLLFLASFMPMLMNAQSNTAFAQSTHTITINNNCSDTIHVGAVPPVQSVSVGGVSQTTLGGWEMTKGQSATVLVPLSYNSGRFWARTGCNFNTTGTCDSQKVTVNGVEYTIANCCDTGGCTNSGGDFALDCVNTGLPPATLAEITFVQNGQDSYDVSMVDGGNISVDMIPDPSTYDCTNNGNCIFTGNLPGKNNSTCSQDSDCYPLFGFGYKWKCDPNMKMCVNPFFCGSPGCTDSKGCAPEGLTQSTLSPSTWGGSSELAISQSNCPADMQLTNDQNQGTTYVGCFAPQKFCRKSCSADGDCGPPYTFNCGTTSGYCEDTSGTVLGADCDTTVGNTTNEQLWACTGVNAGSCFTTGTTDANCCGCPNWAPGFPNAAPDGACVAGNNSNWGSNAQPVFSVFNDASPTAYAFPFDDAIKLFACQAKTGSVTNYTINFCCINSDGDGICNDSDTDLDNDGITNSEEIDIIDEEVTTSGKVIGIDLDSDGVTNEFDLDSDNDGVPDLVEAGGVALDQDFNGRVDDNTDQDGDGLADVGDPSEGGQALIAPDTDGDGIPDTLDIDSDNDGKTDFEESGGIGDNDGDGLVDDKTDSNGDGYLDIFDPDFGGTPLTIVDSNGDGLPDRLDASDGSGGCSLSSKGQSSSILILMLIPAIVIWRRIFRNMM
ncbi:MAG: hypothetical protein DHS20C13_01110 [Thermodesulfobacteriota bacterium]|nr:MAG: hypothetical protein DHS20C13_01110 [Thermodesulfobacteriota bacterium]